MKGKTDQEMGTGNLWKVETQVLPGTHAEIREKGSPSEDLEDAQKVKIKKSELGATAEHVWNALEKECRRKEQCLVHCGHRHVGEKAVYNAISSVTGLAFFGDTVSHSRVRMQS